VNSQERMISISMANMAFVSCTSRLKVVSKAKKTSLKDKIKVLASFSSKVNYNEYW